VEKYDIAERSVVLYSSHPSVIVKVLVWVSEINKDNKILLIVPFSVLEAPKRLSPLTLVKSAELSWISGGNFMSITHPIESGTGVLNSILYSAFS
jgi:hypothetical protein